MITGMSEGDIGILFTMNNGDELRQPILRAFSLDIRLSESSPAEEPGVHRTTLNRLVLKEMGMTPGNNLQKLRIQHTRSLQCGTELPIKAVAAECGMPYDGYFCRLIRRITGLTPAACRKHGGVD